MLNRPLGRTKLKVSTLGYGAVPLSRGDSEFQIASDLLNQLLDSGVNLIDTAAGYGASEEVIGKAISHRKSEFTLITKCGMTDGYAPAWSPAEIASTIDRSLRRLRLDCADVILLHSCALETLQKGEVTEVLKRAQKQGKTRFIGYSGDNQALKFAIQSNDFDVVECSFSILDQANAPAIALASEKDVGVMIKRPVANAVPGRSSPPQSEYSAQYWPRWLDFRKCWGSDQPPTESWIDTAMRFAAFWPGVTSALVGSGNINHVRDNLRMIESGPLDSKTVEKLVSVYKLADRNWPGMT